MRKPKITITIEPWLLERVHQEQAQTGVDVSGVVGQALRVYFRLRQPDIFLPDPATRSRAKSDGLERRA